jgi:hypothetical protein
MIPSPTFFLLLQKMNKKEQNEQTMNKKERFPMFILIKKLGTKQKKKKSRKKNQNFDTKFKETLTLN